MLPAVPQRAAGAVLTVTSNMHPIVRESVSVFSYFLHWNDVLKWTTKLRFLQDLIDDQESWILSECGEVVYALSDLTVADSPNVVFAQGPTIDSLVIPTHRLFRQLIQRAAISLEGIFNSEPNCVDLRVTESDWVSVSLLHTAEKSRFAISVIPTAPRVPYSCPLSDLYETHDQFTTLLQSQRKHRIVVECNHYAEGIPRRYTVVGLSSFSAEQQQIVVDGQAMTVAEYFSTRIDAFKEWTVELTRPDLPLAIDQKGRFLPLELCRVDCDLRTPISANATCPDISTVTQHAAFHFMAKFGLAINSAAPMQTRGRQVVPNQLRSIPLARPVACQVVSFADGPGPDWNERESKFLSVLAGEAERRSGTHLFTQLLVRTNHDWEETMKSALAKLRQSADLFLVLVDKRLPDETYRRLKTVFEEKLRVSSQVVSLDRVETVGHDASYWVSLVNQMAQKIGPTVTGKPTGTVVGGIAAACVPRTGCKLTSVSMSYDNAMSAFHNQSRIAVKREEFDFAEVFYESIIWYCKTSGVFPNRLIFYVQQPRASAVFSITTGLLRGAHAAASRINRELKTGINPKLGYGNPINPNWTFVMVKQERGMRLKTESRQMCVVSGALVSGNGLEFFLQPSPEARPVKYTVIHDANSFTVPEIENFTHQICGPGESLPGPVVHAAYVAERIQMHVAQNHNVFRTKSAHEIRDYVSQTVCSPDIPYNGFR